jgi:hypothetical protein
MWRRWLAVALGGSLLACAQVPNPKTQVDAPKTVPDRQYVLEKGGGQQRVLVWDCLDGSRIVMTNSCRQLMCESDWTVHKSMCGGGDGWWDVPMTERKPMPSGTGW